jgi:tetratricopeptide (TPR) repeat protein
MLFLGQGLLVHSQLNTQQLTTLFSEKKYDQARSLLESEIENGTNTAATYLNLGSCYVSLQEYGPAIWAFENTLKSKPFDQSATDGILYCYLKLDKKDKWSPSYPWIVRYRNSLGSNFWAYLAIFFSICFATFTYLSFKLTQTSWKRLMMLFCILFLLGATLSTYFSHAIKRQLEQTQFAIVVSTKTALYKKGYELDKTFINLYEGDRIKVLTQYANYLQIELKNKQHFLIQSKDVKLL